MSIKHFGIETTYNPFSNAEDLQQVSNQVFNIPSVSNFANVDVIVVSTGLVPTRKSFLSADFSAAIINDDGSTIAELESVLGQIGYNTYPQINEIIWFDEEGMQSAFWIHSDYLGKQLKISGKFQTTAITAEVFYPLSKLAEHHTLIKTDIFERAGTYNFNNYLHPQAKYFEVEVEPAGAGGGGGGGGGSLSLRCGKSGAGGNGGKALPPFLDILLLVFTVEMAGEVAMAGVPNKFFKINKNNINNFNIVVGAGGGGGRAGLSARIIIKQFT